MVSASLLVMDSFSLSMSNSITKLVLKMPSTKRTRRDYEIKVRLLRTAIASYSVTLSLYPARMLVCMPSQRLVTQTFELL